LGANPSLNLIPIFYNIKKDTIVSDVVIWHNPKCSKSRDSLRLLEDRGLSVEIVKYLDNIPNKDELKQVIKLLGIKSAKELMRTKESIYKELNLDNQTDEDMLISAMIENPKLIERPIVIIRNRAVIGRPIDRVIELLDTII
jgi:arsenate reductase